MSKVRTLLEETKLPKHLWGEAIRCATYQLNRSPTKALDGEIPAEIFHGKINLENLKVFGAKAWTYILPTPQDKLDPRATECIMVGYGENGHRLWVPETDEVIISRDATFDEQNFIYNPNQKEKNANETRILQPRYLIRR